MNRCKRTSNYGLAAWPLLCSALFSACTGCQQSSEDLRSACGGRCGEPDLVCAPASDGGVEALYEFTPEDVQELAQGTWTGRYPGGDAADAFDVTVTVTELEPAMYMYPDDGVQLYQPHATGQGVEIDEEFRQSCVAMAVPALVHVEASDPAFTLDPDLRHVWVFGTSLLPEPFESSASEVKHPPGIATAGREINGSQFEIEYWFVFGTDGRLWISVERDGAATRYMESGSRE